MADGDRYPAEWGLQAEPRWAGRETPEPRRKRRLGTVWIVAIAGGCLVLPLLVIALVVGAGAAYWKLAEEQSPDEDDWAAIPTIEDVSYWCGWFESDPVHEALVKRRFPDGSWQLEYEYEAPESLDHPYMLVYLDREQSVSDARDNFVASSMVGPLASTFGEDGMEARRTDELYSGGDQSACITFEFEGEVSRQNVIVRSGSCVLDVTLYGVAADEPGQFADLLDAFVEELTEWSPEQP